jgi:hypothetical protein
VPELKIAFEESDLGSLPPHTRALFGNESVFSTHAWYRTTVDHALPQGSSAAFVVARRANDILAILPMQHGPRKSVAALSTPYTCLWNPLLPPDWQHNKAILAPIGRALGAFYRSTPTIRLEALDAESPSLAPLLGGLHTAGFIPLTFDHFGNWHLPIPQAQSWDAFLAARPGALREAIRRRSKRLMAGRGAEFSIHASPHALEPAIAKYETIYAASWKQPEPFKDFNAAFMRAAAAENMLRLGLLERDGAPLAAQFWVLHRGTATVLKLAHDEAHRALSPGTVLTALMIRHFLEQEHITGLDFGRGDDEYKKLWTGERRQRIGVLLANPLTFTGAAAILRHKAGKARKFFSEEKNERTCDSPAGGKTQDLAGT